MLMNAVGACVPLDGVGPTSVVVRTSTRNRVDAIVQPDGSVAALGTAYHVTVRQTVASAWPDWSDPRVSTTASAPIATAVATTLKIAVTMTVRRTGASCLAGWWSLRLIPSRRVALVRIVRARSAHHLVPARFLGNQGPHPRMGEGWPGRMEVHPGHQWVNRRRERQTTTRGRIISCSSCSRMWQCHTYSAPPAIP